MVPSLVTPGRCWLQLVTDDASKDECPNGEVQDHRRNDGLIVGFPVTHPPVEARHRAEIIRFKIKVRKVK